jgi:hypothetical protein
VLGFIAEADYKNLLNGGTWKIQVPSSAARDPTPAKAAMAGLLGRAARVCAGQQFTMEDEKKAAIEAEERKLALARSTAQAAQTMQTSGKKVKLSAVIDQLSEGEEMPLDKQFVDGLYQVFYTSMGREPKACEDLTADQLTAFHSVVVKEKGVPYADFSVWAPFGVRMAKALKCRGLMQQKNGEMREVEVPGPPNFRAWEQCWRVFRTACIMFKLITMSTLETYYDKIRNYCESYGETRWLLIYQCDVRARQEHWQRCLRKAETKHKNAVIAGQSSIPANPGTRALSSWSTTRNSGRSS